MMLRQHPLLSPVALLGTLLLLILLSVALWQTGGRAFSPGEVSAVSVSGRKSGGVPNHAAVGDDCSQCHQPFAGTTAARCEQCHTVVQAQRFRQVGLHGRVPAAACADCHQEHQGAEFDLFAAALAQFNTEHHTLLFPLDGAHTDLDCTDCHQADRYVETPADCAGCHAEPLLHQDLFGLTCQQCHNTADWRPARLTQHFFPLDHGGEGGIPCGSCHEELLVVYTCDTCHAPQEMLEVHEDVTRHGTALDDCAACHVTGTEAETESLRRDS